MTLPPALAPLGALRQWVTYRLVPAENGKTDKMPCNWQTGNVASAQEPGNWTTYEQAASMAILADRGHGSGAGFVVSVGDPYWFLDIDKCLLVDGTWSPLAIELCTRLAGCAVEVSQSGRGLHILGRGIIPKHRCKNIPLGLELYTELRFVAITGANAQGCVDTDASAAISSVVADYFAPTTQANGPLDDWTNEPCEGWNGPRDDAELIRMARAAKPKNDPAVLFGKGTPRITFAQLWDGDEVALAAQWPSPTDQAYDASAADASLAFRLAYWTGRDCERTERLMRMSGLMREKYERRNYIEPTIMRAAGAAPAVRSDPPPKVPPPPVEPTPTNRSLLLSGDQFADKADHQNIEYNIVARGNVVQYDEFAERILLNGEPLTDNTERLLWMDIRESAMLKFPKDLFGETLRAMAYRNRFHPLRIWLDQVQPTWDGVPRIDSWLTTYLGVEASPYVSAVGALFLTAAVRRARQPGAKFDELMVLEGEQGLEKSTAIATLSPDPTWFCDDVHVGMKSKELLEQTAGKWLVEAPELSKMNDSEVEHVKAMLSRQNDRSRLAYERNATERGRGWVAFATTNAQRYLRDPSGNRRIWPIKCGAIDLAALTAHRPQLWAEAAQREATGASIRLDKTLWAAAALEQADRLVSDPFEDVLRAALGPLRGCIRTDLLWDILGIAIERRPSNTRKMGEAMQRLGWTWGRVRVDGERVPVYRNSPMDMMIEKDNDHKLLIGPPVLRVIPGGVT